jgi:hypothetical protein
MVRSIMKDMEDTTTMPGMGGTTAADFIAILTVMRVMIPVIGMLVIRSVEAVGEDEVVVVEGVEGEVVVAMHNKLMQLVRRMVKPKS